MCTLEKPALNSAVVMDIALLEPFAFVMKDTKVLFLIFLYIYIYVCKYVNLAQNETNKIETQPNILTQHWSA